MFLPILAMAACNRTYGEFCHPTSDCGRFRSGNGNNVSYGISKLPKVSSSFRLKTKYRITVLAFLERTAAAKPNDPYVHKISLFYGPLSKNLGNLSGKNTTAIPGACALPSPSPSRARQRLFAGGMHLHSSEQRTVVLAQDAPLRSRRNRSRYLTFWVWVPEFLL